MSSLSERMQAALKSRKDSAHGERVNKAGLARACKIAASSVNDWFTGKTKSLEGENLIHAAAYLRVSVNWLATGAGPMAPYPSPSSTDEPAARAIPSAGKIAHDPEKAEQSHPSQFKGVSQVVANARVGKDGDFIEEWFDDGQGGWVQSVRDVPTYALRIKGNALAPVYDNGKILLVEPGAPLAEDEDIVVRWKDGRNSILRLMREGPESLVVLSVLGGPPQTIDLADTLEVQAVYGSVGGSKWRPAADLQQPAAAASPATAPQRGELIDETANKAAADKKRGQA